MHKETLQSERKLLHQAPHMLLSYKQYKEDGHVAKELTWSIQKKKPYAQDVQQPVNTEYIEKFTFIFTSNKWM